MRYITILLAALLAFQWSVPANGADSARSVAVKRYTDDVQKALAARGIDPRKLVVKDTGDKVADGEAPCPEGLGDCPIVDVHVIGQPVECLVLLHPTEHLHMNVMCVQVDPEVES